MKQILTIYTKRNVLLIYAIWIESIIILTTMILILRPFKKRLDLYVSKYKELTDESHGVIGTYRYFLLPLYWSIFIWIYFKIVKIIKFVIYGDNLIDFDLKLLYMQDLLIFAVLLTLFQPLRKQIKNYISNAKDEGVTGDEKRIIRILMPIYWFCFSIFFFSIAVTFINIVFNSEAY